MTPTPAICRVVPSAAVLVKYCLKSLPRLAGRLAAISANIWGIRFTCHFPDTHPLTLDIVNNNDYGHDYQMRRLMQSMSVTMFKAKALRKIAQVAASREPIVITRHGRPVVTVVPWTEPPSADSSFGKLAGSVLREGDLVYSVSDGSEWEVGR